jgi:hypothetical protein
MLLGWRHDIQLNDTRHNDKMLMLCVAIKHTILIFVLISVAHYAYCLYDECHYAVCHYADCRYAECR